MIRNSVKALIAWRRPAIKWTLLPVAALKWALDLSVSYSYL